MYSFRTKFLLIASSMLMLTTSAIMSSQMVVKNSLQTPLGRVLSSTYKNVLLPELIALILSYTQYAHTCEENVPVYALEILPDNTIAAGLANGEIHIIDPTADPLQKKAVVKILHEHTGPVTTLKWLATEQMLLSGSTMNGHGILGIEEQINEQAGKHQLALVAILHNEIHLDKSDERVILWELASGTPLHIISPKEKHKASAVSVVKSKYFDALFHRQTSICKRVVNLTRKEHVSDIVTECEPRTVVSARRTYDADFGSYCVEGCNDGTCNVFLREQRMFYPCNGHTKPIRAIKEIEPGLFATAAEDGAINIVSANPARWIDRIDNGHRGPVYALAVLQYQNRPVLVAGFANGTLQMYSFEIETSIKERKKLAERLP